MVVPKSEKKISRGKLDLKKWTYSSFGFVKETGITHCLSWKQDNNKVVTNQEKPRHYKQ